MSGSSNSRYQKFSPQLDLKSGVPVYRQIIDQVLGGMSRGTLRPGDQLPTVRQLAVDLAINPNTVVRAYRELEIREILTTQQGTGTFLTTKKPKADEVERQRRITQLVTDTLAKAGADGITLDELIEQFGERKAEQNRR
jgi:GntR family transcriptional regulator